MLHKPVYSPENERACLSVMSLAANERGSGIGPAPCFCMAAHMLLQHHIFTMRHRHVEMVATFKTLTNKTPRRSKKRVELTCACLHDTENDNSCDGDLVNTWM